MNYVVRILPDLKGARYGSSTDKLRMLFVAFELHELPHSAENMWNLMKSSLRVCIGITQETSGILVVAEASETYEKHIRTYRYLQPPWLNRPPHVCVEILGMKKICEVPP